MKIVAVGTDFALGVTVKTVFAKNCHVNSVLKAAFIPLSRMGQDWGRKVKIVSRYLRTAQN